MACSTLLLSAASVASCSARMRAAKSASEFDMAGSVPGPSSTIGVSYDRITMLDAHIDDLLGFVRGLDFLHKGEQFFEVGCYHHDRGSLSYNEIPTADIYSVSHRLALLIDLHVKLRGPLGHGAVI